uniref:SbcC/MukB-like Walker B domain-containing protein n=1 Tax=Actinotalea sp. TaxID=1872145 RepID=UPI00356223F4
RAERAEVSAGELRTAREELSARPAARTALEHARARALQDAAGLGAATAALAGVEDRWAAAHDAALLEPRIAQAQTALAAAADRATVAVDAAAALQRARIAGMAGELAERLVDGDPCPVCGAREHPAIATRPEPVDDADLAAAEDRRAAATDALTAASTALHRLRDRHEQRLLVAAAPLAELEQLRTATRAEVAAAQAATTALAAAEDALTAFDARTQELTSTLVRREQEVAVEAERQLAASGRLDLDRAEVLDARGTSDCVADRVAELERTAREAAGWIAALEADRAARDAEVTARRALAEALVEHDLDDESEVESARLPPAELLRLERSVQRREADLARVRGVLEEPEVRDAAAEVDVPAAWAALTEAAARAEACAALAARESARRDAATGALDALGTAVAEHGARTADAGPVVRMANLAAASTADNTRALTLATFVLGRRFDDLVLAANARLVTMSDGRYELLHSERREDVSARKKGLALAVMDHRTGAARDPRTLSGGETFYVSLCLALGLADVVTAEAGGIDLGTLFVDEGFGSLDPEALDVVLSELSRLRDGGRVVGVVSHVETMKSAIAERIEVRRRPDGSSTLSVRA